MAQENALGHAQTFARVGVIRADLDASEFAEGHFFGGVVEENEGECVAGILRSNEMRERHGHTLSGREAIFAVENHAVAAIQHQHRRA